MPNQCRFFDAVTRQQCTEEGTELVRIGKPSNGAAVDYHFCATHVNQAKESAKELIANAKERQAAG